MPWDPDQVRRRAAVVMLALVAGLLAGCDPAPPAPDGQAELWVIVGADGHARTDVVLDSADSSDDRLLATAREVATRLFPTSTGSTFVIERNRGGYPYATIDTPGVYEPGSVVTFSLDTRAAVSWLLTQGISAVAVTILVPETDGRANWQPPQTGSGRWDWRGIADGAAAPAGSVRLTPRLVRPFGAAAVLLAALALAVLSIRAGRKRTAVLLSCGALAAAVTFAWLDRAGAVIDTLGVRGILHGAAARADALLLPLDLVLPFGAIALVVAVASRAQPGATPAAQTSAPTPD